MKKIFNFFWIFLIISNFSCTHPSEIRRQQKQAETQRHQQKEDERFSDSGNVVTEKETGLIWQKCSAGQSGSNCEIGKAKKMQWSDAFSYCSSLDLGEIKNWKLPNIIELSGLIDNFNKRGNEPRTNTKYFPNTQTYGGYWSSDTGTGKTLLLNPSTNRFESPVKEGSIEGVQVVNFLAGIKAIRGATELFYVRCVSKP